LGNFPKPVAFPQDKQEPPKNYKRKPTILTDVIDQNHTIVSHPSLMFLIKTVVPSKFSKFSKRMLSLLSAR
jgi:hypothetical protein